MNRRKFLELLGVTTLTSSLLGKEAVDLTPNVAKSVETVAKKKALKASPKYKRQSKIMFSAAEFGADEPKNVSFDHYSAGEWRMD